MTFLHIQTYIHEIGLHTTRPSPSDLPLAQISCRDWYSSVARTETLVSCIDAAKNYLDCYLTLSIEEMHQNTIMQEMDLFYATLILGRYTTGVDSPYLGPEQLREVAQFGHYMTALVNHMSKLITITHDGTEQIDIYWHCRRIFQFTIDWLQVQIKGGYFTTLETSGVSECLDLSIVEILHMEQEVFGDPKHAKAPAILPRYEEQLSHAVEEPWPMSTLDPRVISMNGDF
jgi:hypothetical protein